MIILQNSAHEPPGAILDFVPDARVVRVDQGEPLPLNADHLISLGSPVEDDSWVLPQARLMESTLLRGGRVLGLCFGAQLLARVLGARTFTAPEREIGWHRVRFDFRETKISVATRELELFQWHGEAFELPREAKKIAESDACPLQGFAWRDQAIALASHPEITPAIVKSFISEFWNPAHAGRYVQTPEQMRERMHLEQGSRVFLKDLLEAFAK